MTAARAVWKGVIDLGPVRVPVKLYSGVEDRAVRFRLLHGSDQVPVKQRMVNPETGDPVEYSEAEKAYRTDDGAVVVLEKEELEEIEPEPSREIEITRFVPASAVDHPWYDRPYYLGPDGAHGTYAALAEALDGEERVGIARWAMRKKEYRGVLRSVGRHLMLVALHAREEIVPVSALDAPDGRDLQENELRMARQLVEALTGDFVPEEYENEYRNRVLELVRAKASGEVVELREPERREPEPDLTTALEKSLREAQERKSA